MELLSHHGLLEPFHSLDSSNTGVNSARGALAGFFQLHSEGRSFSGPLCRFRKIVAGAVWEGRDDFFDASRHQQDSYEYLLFLLPHL